MTETENKLTMSDVHTTIASHLDKQSMISSITNELFDNDHDNLQNELNTLSDSGIKVSSSAAHIEPVKDRESARAEEAPPEARTIPELTVQSDKVEQPQDSAEIVPIDKPVDHVTKAWRDRLHGAHVLPFPPRQANGVNCTSTSSLQLSVEMPWQCASHDDGAADRHVLAQAALALLLSARNNISTVSYLNNVSLWATPTSHEVQHALPCQIDVCMQHTVEQYLNSVRAALLHAPQMPLLTLEQISQVSDDAKTACDTQIQFMAASSDVLAADLDCPQPAHTMAITYRFTVGKLDLSAAWNADLLHADNVQWFLEQLVQAVLVLYQSPPERKLFELNTLCKSDIMALKSWDSGCPTKVDQCLTHIFNQIVQQYPDLQAIAASEGSMTYIELDKLSSKIALHLISSAPSLLPGGRVVLCFEKSIMAIAAVLAVMKCGATTIMIDPSTPRSRCGTIVDQINPDFVLCAPTLKRFFWGHKNLNLHMLDMEIVQEWSITTELSLPTFSADTSAAVIFTSGSTGIPKGTEWSHSNIACVLVAAQDALKTDSSTRLLQFAPCGVGAFYGELLLSLLSGGCLCIMTIAERAERFPMFVAEHKVNFAFVTTSVGARMPPFAFPSLKTLLMGAEPMTKTCLEAWENKVRLIQAYGNTESVALCSWNLSYNDHVQLTNIGRPFVGRFWLTKPDNVHQLVSIGEVGEILIEGYHLAKGYVGQPEMTAQAFINGPSWSTSGPLADLFRGCERRFYRSGDLAIQLPNGCYELKGRKDLMLKVRGHRVEREDIEACIVRHLPGRSVAVDGVVFDAEKGDLVLVAYIAPLKPSPGACEIDASPLRRAKHAKTMGELRDYLSSHLPSYMVPTLYLPVMNMPIAQTGKIDRKILLSLTTELGREGLFSFYDQDSDKVAPITRLEIVIQQIWADVLNIPAEQISTTDNFFHIGGNSLSAMRAIASARENDLNMKIQDLLQMPVLKDLAAHMSGVQHNADILVEPFSLFEDVAAARLEAMSSCDIADEDIEDILPITALQEGLIVSGLVHAGAYTAQFAFKIPEYLDYHRLRATIDALYRELPVLRTRMFQRTNGTLMQVIVNAAPPWHEITDPARYLEDDQADLTQLGSGLARFAWNEETRSIIISVHHAIYDAWSLRLTFRRMIELYRNPATLSTFVPFRQFIKHISDVDNDAAKRYWREQLDAATQPTWPAESPTYKSGSMTRITTFTRSGMNDIVQSTLARCAMALVVGQYADARDVILGEVRSGRNAPVQGILDICAPTIATVPVRVKWQEHITVGALLHDVQRQAFDIGVFEQYGLQNIRYVSDDARTACDFRALLVVQDSDLELEKKHAAELGCTFGDTVDRLPFDTCPLVLQCFFAAGEYTCVMNYNADTISSAQAARFLDHFDHSMAQLDDSSLAGQKLADLPKLVDADLEDIRRFNDINLEANDKCLHHLFEATAKSQPDDCAITAHDGTLTYRSLDLLATQLSHVLRASGVKAGDIVPMFFEKSMYAIITMIAVLKCRAAYCPLDITHPTNRLKDILMDISAHVVLASDLYAERATAFEHQVLRVNSASCQQEPCSSVNMTSPTPDDLAYCLFTSGSTGKPKGVLTSHRAISTSVSKHGAYGLVKSTRLLQFSAFTFDTSVVEIFSTLINGGSICMPSEIQRLEDIVGAVNSFGATAVILTPTFATLITPEMCPGLNILVLAGEPIRRELISLWADRVRLVNAYGVTEASVCNMIAEITDSSCDRQIIGTPLSSKSWIVDQDNHNRLVPVGVIGELAIEGPILAKEYLKDNDRTDRAFVCDATFFSAVYPASNQQHRIYKTGDLVKQQLNGLVEFVGRKDTQVKLRGLRIELGEIEYVAQRTLGRQLHIAAVLIASSDDARPPFITLFIGLQPRTAVLAAAEEDAQPIMDMLPALRSAMESDLPSYMIPATCHILMGVPVSSTGKIDRQSLQNFGSANRGISLLEPASAETGPIDPAETSAEMLLQDIWAKLLHAPKDSIGKQSSFIRLGGDSIVAVRLAAALRQQQRQLTLENILSYPLLEHMALRITTYDNMLAEAELRLDDDGDRPQEPLQRDETIGETQDFQHHMDRFTRPDVVAAVAQKCGINADEVEDVYPAFPRQELWRNMARECPSAGDTLTVFELSRVVDTDRLKSAWRALVQLHAILRTRLVQLDDDTWVQVVIKNAETRFSENSSVTKYHAHETRFPLTDGQPLYRAGFVFARRKRYFCVTTCHSVRDGWLDELLVTDLAELYTSGLVSRTIVTPKLYWKTLQRVDETAFERFWNEHMSNSPVSQPWKLDGQPVSHSMAVLETPLPGRARNREYLMSTIIHFAWALAFSQLMHTDQAVFWMSANCRKSTLAQAVVAPLLNIIPSRVKIDAKRTLRQHLEIVQQDSISKLPFELTARNLTKDSQQPWRGTMKDAITLTITPYQELDKAAGLKGAFKRSHRMSLCGSADQDSHLSSLYTDDTIVAWAWMDERAIPSSKLAELLARFQEVLRQLLTGDLEQMAGYVIPDTKRMARTIDKVVVCSPVDVNMTYDRDRKRMVSVQSMFE